MNARIAKEFRPLLLPWMLSAFAAALHFVSVADPVLARGEFGSFLLGLARVAFVTGVLVLSALPVGFELHDRTLLLLFSQPADRTRLWREKLNAATFSVFALAILHGAASALTGHLSPPDALLYSVFAVTAICSVGYHTLAARSVIVGIASAIATPFAIALGGYLVVYYVLGLNVQLSEEETIALIVIGCTSYSAFFLWFGRRQFITLELKDAGVPRGAQIPERLVPRKLTELFRSRPTCAAANLIRKEVCLQKPIFLVSAIFTGCWLLTLALMVLRPAWQDNCVAVLNGLTGTQIVLMVILTGCVSLGDDKALGTAAWHLTLPVSSARQWVIKLLVAGATLLAMAAVLPLVLASLTLFKARVGLLDFPWDDNNTLIVGALSVVLFVLSFWSASMVTNTVRAALTMVLSAAALAMVVFLGVWSAHALGGLQTGLLTSLIARYQWSPYSLGRIIPFGSIACCLIIGVLIVALIQSLRQFRRAQSKSTTILRYGAILALVAFAVAFWTEDFNLSRRQVANSPLIAEVTEALRSIPLNDSDLWGTSPRRLEIHDLEKTGQLSKRARQWLRNSTIDAGRVESGSRQFADLLVYSAMIKLPNGDSFPCTWSIPKP